MSSSQPINAAIAPEIEQENTFETRKIIEIVSGHFIHDTFTAFVAPVLPLLIDKLSLSLTQAGSLSMFLQLPSLLNIFIGYIADQINLRYFVIFAPAATATLVSLLGITPTYLTLCLLLFVAGISSAAFHVPAPAMIGQISGKQIGRGMSYFMAGGELGRTVGPLLVTWGVAMWGLEGIWRLAAIGWVTSAFLYWRFHDVSATVSRKKTGSLRDAMPRMRRLFLPLGVVMFLRTFVISSLAVFLVVLLEADGYSLARANQALALWSFAGIGGALMGGTLSDTFGRKQMIAAGIGLSALLMLALLQADGFLLIPVLLAHGFVALSVTPVIQAMVQEYLVENRAMANGVFMLFAFIFQSLGALLIGFMGDYIGLEGAFMVSAFAALASLPFVFLLPESQTK